MMHNYRFTQLLHRVMIVDGAKEYKICCLFTTIDQTGCSNSYCHMSQAHKLFIVLLEKLPSIKDRGQTTSAGFGRAMPHASPR